MAYAPPDGPLLHRSRGVQTLGAGLSDPDRTSPPLAIHSHSHPDPIQPLLTLPTILYSMGALMLAILSDLLWILYRQCQSVPGFHVRSSSGRQQQARADNLQAQPSDTIFRHTRRIPDVRTCGFPAEAVVGESIAAPRDESLSVDWRFRKEGIVHGVQ